MLWSKKTANPTNSLQKQSGNLGHNKKTKSKNNRGRRRIRIADQKPRKYIQQNYRRKFSQPKERYSYEGSRSIQNTEQTGSKKKSPRHIIIKTQNIQIKERILRTAKEKDQETYKGKPIRLTLDYSMETMKA